VADNATLYGVCLHVQEVVQRPPSIYGPSSPLSQLHSSSSRCLVSAPRCYCILTRVPFFELHYEMLNSIISQERLNRITKFVNEMALADNIPSQPVSKNNNINEKIDSPGAESATDWLASAIPVDSAMTLAAAAAGIISDEEASSRWEISPPGSPATSDISDYSHMRDLDKDCSKNVHTFDDYASETSENRSTGGLTPDVGPFIYHRNQSADCLRSFEYLFSPARSMVSEEDDEFFYNPDEDPRDHMIMEWARENKNDLLQIICAYHCMHLPERGKEIIFRPLEHLQAIVYRRPPVSALGLCDKYLDLEMKDSKEASQVKLKLATAEEAVSLSLWSTATICRVLPLESVLALVTGVLLEKQVVVLCPNLGVLSAVVLSLIPIIRPFEWQSLFLPILPGKMVDFLDAPVPFIAGIQHKLPDLKMRTSNLVRVNIPKTKVKTCTLPLLPKRKELLSELRPIHSILSREASVAQRHPVYRCNEVQADAAAQFLSVMNRYLESLCADLRLHTITSVQSNNDKVSLLLKDSFIDSFPAKDQAFIKLFVETQMFTVLSDSRLSSFENE
ncbi:UNVERIFIED_CONTAM: DENN domain-containing protein 5B, partial [Sesamum radiatum]